jgi:hypothetical protein
MCERSRSDALVGRGRELAVLRGAVDRAAQGCGGAVVVLGEAGIGKSRLLAEVSCRALSQGMEVLVGNAVAGGGSFRAIAAALADRSGQVTGRRGEGWSPSWLARPPPLDAPVRAGHGWPVATGRSPPRTNRHPQDVTGVSPRPTDHRQRQKLRNTSDHAATPSTTKHQVSSPARNIGHPHGNSCFAVFVDHVPAAAQAARTARVSCGVACSGHGSRNLAAMMTRRSLMVMSS